MLSAVEVMKIIKPPAPLEYTEVTEPVAQLYGLRSMFFSVFSVLSRVQPGWLNLYFIGSHPSLRAMEIFFV
ncbi:MAG: hypothetical protein A2096_12935 [Spirochaetes bacterium GWF1_41_5]|nr:MAG: hypothetical protein A2096_12935 [Spirochaetes bacterium GWF1_41_5]